MNWRPIGLIIKREYLDRVRSTSFAIGTVLGVVGIIALSFLPQLFQLINQETTLKVAIVDPHNLISSYLPADVEPQVATGTQTGLDQNPSISARIKFSRASATDPSLNDQVKSGKLGGYVVVQGDKPSNVEFVMHVKERPGVVTNSRLLLLLSNAATQARIRESGISPEQVAALFSTPSLKMEPVSGVTLKDEKAAFQAQALVYALLILLYMTTLMYGLQVAMGVVYEKSNRVIEILITSVRPIELMLGKVFGIGLLGLTQYGAWVLVGLAGFMFSSVFGGSSASASAGGGLELASVPPSTLFFFLVFFLLGYLVYAALYAALGSLVNRTEEVNSITTPVTIIVVGVYLLSMLALGNPEAEYVKWLSFLPFLSPMLMFIRIALSSPAWWEPLVAIALLIASVFFFSWLAARIYRIGVLMYGKRPSFREIGRQLRAS